MLKIHIITSSYPPSPDDPSTTMGVFVRQFAMELNAIGHQVVVQPVARKKEYKPDQGITIVPTPWTGGDQDLASMNFMSPRNWWIFFLLFLNGIKKTIEINREYKIDKTLCMLAVPSGVFGLAGKIINGIPYDIWVLGSDIWKIRKIPLIGPLVLRLVARNAENVYADGMELCDDVTDITGVQCKFLRTSRSLPRPKAMILPYSDKQKHFLYVGRYHVNKGPDLLIRAISYIPPEVRHSIHLHMFGHGPMEHELKQLIASLHLQDCIDLHGSINAQDFSNYLNAVFFLIIPSRIESIPIVLSDALQIGTPVISTPVGDLEELIKKHHCGIVADDVAPQALANAIIRAMTYEKNTFTNGITKAFESFRIINTVKEWLGASLS